MVLVYDTSKEPTSNAISLPLAGTVNAMVDWGDGTTSSYATSGFKTHTYTAPGIYTVQVSGTLTSLDHGTGASTTSNKPKLVRCLSFGNVGLTSMLRGFRGCANLVEVPASLPVSVATTSEMFRDCTLFNDAKVSSWNTSAVQNMSGMFVNCSSFSRDLSSWNTGASQNTSNMFYGCLLFTSNLSAWNTTFVTGMSNMFYGAGVYTSNMGSWNLSGLNSNSSLDNLMSLTDALSTPDYDSTLVGWNTNKSLYRTDLRPNFGNSKYTCGSAAAAARAALVAYGWTITDGGCVTSPSQPSSSSSLSYDPNKLVLVYDTSKEPMSNTISLPLAGTVNVTVNWGDGTSNAYATSGFKTHTYAAPGIYTVQVSGTLTSLDHGTGASTTSNKLKLVRCLSFGNVGLTSMLRGFRGCTNLVETPASLPAAVTTTSEMFRDCTLFNDAKVSSWNTSAVQNMSGMFVNCTRFSRDLSSWNTANVTSMSNMFYGCVLFSSDLSLWKTGKVTSMAGMFYGVNDYTSNMGAWSLAGLTASNSIDNFLASATGLSIPDYDATLIGWNANKSLYRADLRPNFGGSQYTCGSAAATARAALVARGWTITDGGCV